MLDHTRALFRHLWRCYVKGDEASRFAFAERICARIYPKYAFSEYGRLFLEDTEFRALHRRYHGENVHGLDRMYAVRELLKLVAGVPGDTAECGAYTGATSHVICLGIAGSVKRHHVFDSFAGLSPPLPEDGTHWRAGDLASSEAVIRRNLSEFSCVDYHPGWIPDRFPEVADRRFSFLHLDVDLLRPTSDALAFFYSRISPGGLIVCDDYGFTTCPGAKQAFDEFFADRPEPVVMLPTGQAFIIRR